MLSIRSFHCLQVNFYDSLEAATAENDLDGLVISTPTFTHESVIRHAGVHQTSVFTEKPVDETADKIEALFEYAHRAGIDLCCGFQRRFDPSYVAATAAVQEGQVGTPIMASLFFADHPSPPKDFLLNGGNIFMDLAAHDVDYITHTLQDEVVSVYASGTSSDKDLTAADVQDNATMMMNFQQGAVVTLFMSRSATYGYDQRCEIFGPRGLVSVGNIHANTAVISNANGIRHSRWQYSCPERFAAAFALEMDAWADVLEKGWTWPVTAAQCVRVQRIVDAARLSAAQGSVVTVEAYNESRLD
jgi:myo-inositol 2-dehydrogenase/D-chiro-inositol 1-dehydrogenase